VSQTHSPPPGETGDTTDTESDPWEQLAAKRDTLEMCIEEDTPFAGRAKQLLSELDARGYE